MKPTDQNNNSGKGEQDIPTTGPLGAPPTSDPASDSVSKPASESAFEAKPAKPLGSEQTAKPETQPKAPTEASTSATSAATATGAPSPSSGVDKPGTDKTGTSKPLSEPTVSDSFKSKTTAGSASSKTTPPGGTPPKPPTKTTGPGRGLSGLALLVALAALGLSAWQWYQADQRQLEGATLAEQVAQLQSAQQQQQQAFDQRLEGLPNADEWQQVERLSAEMQRSQQAISQRLDTLQGDAQSDWKLAEAEYLVRLASLRLIASQDVTSARELLTAVDGILRAQPDSGVFAVREQLAQFQGELRALPEIDRAGVFLRLAAMSEQVERLVALPVPVFDPEEVSVEEEYEDRLARRTRAERVLMRLERYVRVDFQRGKVITPLLDEAELQRVQRTLQLTMEQAQWAALRAEQEVYETSLEQADSILRRYFEMENPQVQAMQGQIESLAEENVSLEPPDLSPLEQGLAAYIQSRRAPATGNGEASE
ncbi:uroporphyrinogen-III C-methyltransferase [Pseudomonas sp. NyZ704]|nr:uroporphyrinogen-III C-methyltransferase [Pseudomonas sp. NyZ704]